MSQKKVKDRQSILDLALKFYGDLQKLDWLMEDNPTLIFSPTANVYEGEMIEIREGYFINDLQQELLQRGQEIATLTQNSDRAKGIGFMRIRKDFKII